MVFINIFWRAGGGGREVSTSVDVIFKPVLWPNFETFLQRRNSYLVLWKRDVGCCRISKLAVVPAWCASQIVLGVQRSSVVSTLDCPDCFD